MGVVAFIFAIGLGFGLACFIFASLLSKSNDIGNSIGNANRYTGGIVYDRSVDRLRKDEIESFGVGYIQRAMEEKGSEPSDSALVEQRYMD